jgi:hypothetical protein
MKLTNVILASFGLAIAAMGTPGCAEAAADPSDDVAATTQELERAGSWEKLGESRVQGDYDRDVITVGQDDGRFTSVQIRVTGSSLVMFGIKVVFGNGDVFEPNVRWVFDENTRSRAIDLPGDTRFIKRVEFKYGNIPGGGNARVELFGKNVAPPPDWQNLGERAVNGHGDRDTIVVGTDEGPFQAIQVRVKRSSLVMHDIRVTFGNGEVFEPNVRLVFDENTRSRVIDLPGVRRFIKRVDFKYSNLPTGGDARVQLWATL